MLDRAALTPDRIRQFTPFRDLEDDQLGRVQSQARIIGLAARDPLFRQSEPVHRSYFCLDGRLKLSRFSHDGGEKVFHIACGGETLWDSIAPNNRRCFPLNCTSIVASEVMAVDVDVIADLFDRCHDARFAMANGLIDRLHTLLDHVDVLSADKASFRVASYLLAESRRQHDRVAFRLSASKKHIASYLSLQPETLSRCLSSFRRDGLAESRGREIRILDPDGLRALVTHEPGEARPG
jgi:CRP-like cAMP-binding protein